MQVRIGKWVLVLAAFAALASSPAFGEEAGNLDFMPRGEVVSAPIGFLEYCVRQPDECRQGVRQDQPRLALRRDASASLWTAVMTGRAGNPAGQALHATDAGRDAANSGTGRAAEIAGPGGVKDNPLAIRTSASLETSAGSGPALSGPERLGQTRWQTGFADVLFSEQLSGSDLNRASFAAENAWTGFGRYWTEDRESWWVSENDLTLGSAPLANTEADDRFGQLMPPIALTGRLQLGSLPELYGPGAARPEPALSEPAQPRPAAPIQAARVPGPFQTLQGSAADLDKRAWSIVRTVNRRINQRFRPATDARIYGRNEFWTRPSSTRSALADCEDYALEKRAALIAEGIPAAALTIATALTATNEPHAVLVLETTKGDYVLDNLSRDVRRWSRIDYTWEARQSASDPLVWHSFRQ